VILLLNLLSQVMNLAALAGGAPGPYVLDINSTAAAEARAGDQESFSKSSQLSSRICLQHPEQTNVDFDLNYIIRQLLQMSLQPNFTSGISCML